MINLKINGIDLQVEEGTTILEASKFLGIDIPTLCYYEGLSIYGGCRLCIVEIGRGEKSRLVTACTYLAEEGLEVRTHTERVIKSRKMLIELLLAMCPTSKRVQDLAAKYGVQKVRFKVKNLDCILCGLCVRICAEQMNAKAIGFVNRGFKRIISTPFDMKSDVCRLCGACIYVCPACQLRCAGPGELKENVCGSCLSLSPTCSDFFSEYMCYMGETGSCGTCISEKTIGKSIVRRSKK